MIPKCVCGKRIYPWTRNVARTAFGAHHIPCWVRYRTEVQHRITITEMTP